MLSRSPGLVLVFVFLLIVPGLFWGLPSAITPQVDSPVPMGSLQFFADYRNSQTNITYPAFHQILMLVLYAVAFGVYWIAGGLSHFSSAWPYGLRDASGFFSALILLTNLAAAVMGVVLLRATFPLVQESKKWLWFPLLAMGTNGVFVYYARVGNLDLPYVFWWALATVFLWRYLVGGSSWKSSLLPASVAAGLSAATKDQASGLIAGAGLLLLLYSPLPNPAWRDRLRGAFLFGLAIAVTYGLSAIAPHPARWWNHARFVVSPHAPTEIPFTLAGEMQILWVTIRQLQSVFGIPMLMLAILGVIYLFRSGRAKEFWIVALPLLGYYVVIIAKTRVAYPRFMLPFVFAMVVFTAYGAWRVAERLRGAAVTAWILALSLYLAYSLAVSYLPVTYAQAFDLKPVMAKDLQSLVTPGSPLLASHMQSYEYPNRDVYERYRLMRLPNEPIIPASRHSASIFVPLDTSVEFYLWGTGTAGHPSNTPTPPMPLQGQLIKEWKYPDWVRNTVTVPCILEYRLYRRTAPLPLDYVPPTYIVSGLQTEAQ